MKALKQFMSDVSIFEGWRFGRCATAAFAGLGLGLGFDAAGCVRAASRVVRVGGLATTTSCIVQRRRAM